MTGFVLMLLWLCPAAFIVGTVEYNGGSFSDAGCIAFIPGLNILIALAIFFNGGRL